MEKVDRLSRRLISELKIIDFNYCHSLPYFLFLFSVILLFYFLELRVRVSHVSERMMSYDRTNIYWF